MGTNFYWAGINVRYSTNPKVHIGKRSAAGMYCWDCGLTLCKGGETIMHYDRAGCYNSMYEYGWFELCPKCGQSPSNEVINRGVAIELGFAKPRVERPTGVKGCSSFSWVQEPEKVRERCLQLTNRGRKIVVDEYGRKMTGKQFIEMLDNNCPVEYICIGMEFS